MILKTFYYKLDTLPKKVWWILVSALSVLLIITIIELFKTPKAPSPPPDNNCKLYKAYDSLPKGWICEPNSLKGCDIKCCKNN